MTNTDTGGDDQRPVFYCPRANWGAVVVSTIVVCGFMAILGVLVLRPLAFTTEVADLLKIMLGGLAAKFGDVVMYYIGSSAGSKAKDDAIHASILNK